MKLCQHRQACGHLNWEGHRCRSSVRSLEALKCFISAREVIEYTVKQSFLTGMLLENRGLGACTQKNFLRLHPLEYWKMLFCRIVCSNFHY